MLDFSGILRVLKLSERVEQSAIENIEKQEDGVIVVVQFDKAEYDRRHNSRAVKKTLTIPEWLNEEALAMNINFSQVLQEALMEKVGIR